MKSIALALFLIALGSTAAAQTYRWTDPASGRTVISNLPPPPGVQAKTTRATSPESGNGAGTELPFAIRQAARDFPVTLYVGAQCGAACTGGRALLSSRGIPFAEKTVDTPEVLAELKRLSGGTALPTLLIGRQALVGLSEGQWQSMLDLAGYPQTPPPGYRPPPSAAKETAPPTAEANKPPLGGTTR